MMTMMMAVEKILAPEMIQIGSRPANDQ